MRKADIVLKSSAIFTGLSDEVIQGGIAIAGNQIAEVGGESEIDKWIGPDTKVIEYGDEMIMAGFIDAHMHFFNGAFINSRYAVTSLNQARSAEECVKMTEVFSKEHPELDRIVGFGWLQAYWDDPAALPHRSALDAVISDKPVYLSAVDGHTYWVNSKALEECNITKETKVSFGEIGKDENGELNGLLYEIEACAPIYDKAFIVQSKEMKAIQKEFSAQLAKNGITAVANLSASPVAEIGFRDYEIASELEKSGELSVRLHLYPSLGKDTDLEGVKMLRQIYYTDKLQIAGLKQFVDGVTSTYTAYLLAPYSDNPSTEGFSNYPAELYKKCVVNANREGFSVRLHAVGDAAVRMALDAFEESCKVNDNSGIKNCIEHIESVHPDDIPRFAQLGVIASMQPSHLIIEVNEKVSRIGEERCRYEWPHKTFLNHETTLAFGSDFPVAAINPLPNIYYAITRCDDLGEMIGINPQEKISLAEALRAFTCGSAAAINREQELGTLEAGKLADVIVLSKNLFKASEKEILNTTVRLAIMDGKIVFMENGNN